jgi:diguanylate cyclase (GGDEF)-like protein
MFLILLFSRMFVSRLVVNPLHIIENASSALAKGDTQHRPAFTSNDELGSLSKSINVLAESIEEKVKHLEAAIAKEQAVVREQVILTEMMTYIASGVELDKLLYTFLQRTRDLLRSEHSAIFILENVSDATDPELKYYVDTMEEKTSMDCARAMINGFFLNTIRLFEPLRTDKLSGEIPTTHFEMDNLLAAPLSSADKKLIGLVVLVNKADGFTSDDEESLFSFSFQAFQAITMQQEIVRHASTDGLTGLHNYRIFRKRLDEEMERAKRYSRDLSLLMINIDHFKSFNDIYGHQAGDSVLQTVSRQLLKFIRNTDFAARYGGEEFIVILPETTSDQAYVVAERLRSSINSYEFTLNKKEIAYITVSIGYATFPDDADEPEVLIRKADQGLYMAKENGRNRVSKYYDEKEKTEGALPKEMNTILSDPSLTSVKELAKAIDSKSFYMRGHSFEVAALSILVGRELELDSSQIEGLGIASLLHDIGNLGIPNNVLNKASALTDEEKKIIKGHPGLTEMLLKHYPRAEFILPAIPYHHERYDGKGYPNGLQKDEIPLGAKILAVVEAYHAMVSPRPHRRKRTRVEAIAELERESGRQLDPSVVNVFMKILKTSGDPAGKRKST